jgi:hypothetical protein
MEPTTDKPWKVVGWDTFAGDDYPVSQHATEKEAQEAAQEFLRDSERQQPSERSGGQDGIQDQAYILGPDRVSYWVRFLLRGMKPCHRHAFPGGLSSEDCEALHREIAHELPELSGFLEKSLVHKIEQPFFRQIVVIEATTPELRICGALAGEPRRAWLLSGRPENLSAIAELERPAELNDPKIATAYALNCSDWTLPSSPFGELLIMSFEEIPFRSPLKQEERAAVDELRARIGDRIQPLRLALGVGTSGVTIWLVGGQMLVERTMKLSMNGHFEQQDAVCARGLPVPDGRFWGFVNDPRRVPIDSWLSAQAWESREDAFVLQYAPLPQVTSPQPLGKNSGSS